MDGNAENDVVVGKVGGKVWLPETTSGNAAIDVVGAGCIHPSGNYKQIVNVAIRFPALQVIDKAHLLDGAVGIDELAQRGEGVLCAIQS